MRSSSVAQLGPYYFRDFPVNKHVVFATTRRNEHSVLKHERGMNVPLPIPLEEWVLVMSCASLRAMFMVGSLMGVSMTQRTR